MRTCLFFCFLLLIVALVATPASANDPQNKSMQDARAVMQKLKPEQVFRVIFPQQPLPVFRLLLPVERPKVVPRRTTQSKGSTEYPWEQP